jgi:2-dehydro-3-deoxyphosphogluconate aldolase/(4S)-4-hydroxy-2-oxoglutarate aldolase
VSAAISRTDRPSLPRELTATGVVAIARATSTTWIAAAVETLLASGIRCVELTLTMPGAIDSIATLVKQFGDDACIGAGTVLSAAEARACIDAGAAFLVAPSGAPEVVEVALGYGVPCLPGALTPSEIVAAWQSGAAAVKLFPASLGGPKYLREVRAPLPEIHLIPTGGVAIDDVAQYLQAGAVAVGLGSPLFGDALEDGNLDGLAARARRLLSVVSEVRTGDSP